MGWFNHQLETGKSRNTSNNNLSNEHGTPKRPPNSNCNFRLHHCSLWRSSPGSQQKPTTPGLAGEDIVGFLSIFWFCIPWMWRFRSRDPLFSNGCRLLVNSNTIGCNCYFGISIMQVDLWPFFGMVSSRAPLNGWICDLVTEGSERLRLGTWWAIFDFADQFGTEWYRHGLKKI